MFKKFFGSILMIVVLASLVFTGCKNPSGSDMDDIIDDNQTAQFFADAGIGAYEAEDGSAVLYNVGGANERIVVTDNQVMYFNDFEGAEVVMTMGPDGYPRVISGNNGSVVFSGFENNTFDFVIFDNEGNMEMYYDVPVDPVVFARIEQLMQNYVAANARGFWGDFDHSITLGTIMMDSFLCAASAMTILSPAAPIGVAGTVKFCGGLLISVAAALVEDPEITAALMLAHDIISPEYTLLQSIASVAGSVALAGSTWEANNESEIQVATSNLNAVREDGDIVVTLSWDTTADLDLHVMTPNDHIYYGNYSADGGYLEEDFWSGLDGDERVIWEDGMALNGDYEIYIYNFSDASSTEFEVKVQIGDSIKFFRGNIAYQEEIIIYNFTIDDGLAPAASAMGMSAMSQTSRTIDFDSLPAKY